MAYKYLYNFDTDKLDLVQAESGIDWDNYLFACNTDLNGLTNAFGKAVNSPATLIIDNTGTPVTID